MVHPSVVEVGGTRNLTHVKFGELDYSAVQLDPN